MSSDRVFGKSSGALDIPMAPRLQGRRRELTFQTDHGADGHSGTHHSHVADQSGHGLRDASLRLAQLLPLLTESERRREIRFDSLEARIDRLQASREAWPSSQLEKLPEQLEERMNDAIKVLRGSLESWMTECISATLAEVRVGLDDLQQRQMQLESRLHRLEPFPSKHSTPESPLITLGNSHKVEPSGCTASDAEQDLLEEAQKGVAMAEGNLEQLWGDIQGLERSLKAGGSEASVAEVAARVVASQSKCLLTKLPRGFARMCSKEPVEGSLACSRSHDIPKVPGGGIMAKHGQVDRLDANWMALEHSRARKPRDSPGMGSPSLFSCPLLAGSSHTSTCADPGWAELQGQVEEMSGICNFLRSTPLVADNECDG